MALTTPRPERPSGPAAVVLGLVAVPSVAAVAVVVSRIGDTARFVTWPVAAFTALAAAVCLVGVWAGLSRPWLLVAGLVPALVLSYVLLAAPLAVVACVLALLGALVVRFGASASGLAALTGGLMVIAVVLQGPAVECLEGGVSSGSGPWWIRAPSTSSGSGTSSAEGDASGTTEIGGRRYAYTCVGARLATFGRAGA